MAGFQVTTHGRFSADRRGLLSLQRQVVIRVRKTMT